MSKYLSDLDAEISRTTDDARRGELTARKAAYLSRLGSFDQAQALLQNLRTQFGQGQSTRVSIWLMLAEGLLHTFRDLSDEGADRIMRANVLAGATRDRGLIAATSAWRAFTQSERSEFKGMTRSLNDAFANSDSHDHEVLARLYMVLANARTSLGERAAAHELYMLSRHHALECGDQATIDALIYNKAAFALAWLRAQWALGKEEPDSLSQLRVELKSAKAYQQMVGVSAFSNFVHLSEARLLMLAQEYEAAINALVAVRSMQPFARYNFHESLVDLEIGYCLSQLNRQQEAEDQVRTALASDVAGIHEDDRLFATWLQTRLLQALPHLGDASVAANLLEAAKADFLRSCDQLREALASVGNHPHILRPSVAAPRSIQ